MYCKVEIIAAGGDRLCENFNLLQGLTFGFTTWWNEDLHSRNRTEVDASQTLNE